MLSKSLFCLVIGDMVAEGRDVTNINLTVHCCARTFGSALSIYW